MKPSSSSFKKPKNSAKSLPHGNRFSLNIGGVFVGSQNINPYSGVTTFSQICSTPMQNSTENKPFQYGSHSLHLAKQHQLQAFLNANCTYHASEYSYFEIFNKNDKKCSLLIPDTVLLSSGVISNWYFSSKPNYEVLKKRPQKLQLLQATAVLIKQAVIIAMANGGVKAVSQFWYQNQQTQISQSADDNRGQLSLPPIQLFNPHIKDPDFTMPPGGLLKHFGPASSTTGSNSATPPLSSSNYSSNNITNQFKSLSELNKNCLIAVYEKPIPVGYGRFHSQSQKGRIISSKQLYHTLKQSGSSVKMIQSFIPQRAKQTSYRLVCDYLNIFGSDPPQYIMIRQRSSCAKLQNKKQKITSAAASGSRGMGRIGSPSSSIGGSGMKSSPGGNSPIKNKTGVQTDNYNPLDHIPIKSFDVQTNDKIKNEMKRLIVFISCSNNIVIRRFKACFVRDVSDSIYFVGGKQLYFTKFQVPQGLNSDEQMLKDLIEKISQLPQGSNQMIRLSMQQAQLQQKMRQKMSDQPKDPFEMTKSMKQSKSQANLSGGIFGVSKIPGIKQNQRVSTKQRCQGDFCVFRQNMDEIRNCIKSRKKKQFQTKTDKSKIPLNNFTSSYSCTAFSIPTLLIKKVRDNHDIVEDILDAHCIQRINEYQLQDIEDRQLLEILKGVNPDCKFGGQLYETVQKIRRTNYQNLYTAIKVCKNCYSVYTLLREYFEKIQTGTLNKKLAPKFKPDDRLKQITQATRFLEKITANPKYDKKHKIMTKMVKSQSVASIAQANRTESGGVPVENWIHTQKLIQKHKLASIFNVTRNPFQRESRAAKSRSQRKGQQLDMMKTATSSQWAGANDSHSQSQLLKNKKASPQISEKDADTFIIKDGEQQLQQQPDKNLMMIMSKMQEMDCDLFDFEKINNNKELSKNLSNKILGKLELLKQCERQNKDLSQTKALNKRQLSYNLQERSTIFHEKADVYSRLSTLKRDRQTANMVPNHLLKYSTNSQKIRRDQNGDDNKTQKKCASSATILSPYHQRNNTLTGSPSNMNKKQQQNQNPQQLTSIKMQLGLSANFSGNPQIRASASQAKVSSLLGKNSAVDSQITSARGQRKSSAARAKQQKLELTEKKHLIDGNLQQQEEKQDDVQYLDPADIMGQQMNQLSQIIDAQVTNASKKNKKPALINFYRQNNASRRLTSTALQDNILVKMSAMASQTQQSSQQPENKKKGNIDEIAKLQMERNKSSKFKALSKREQQQKSSLRDFSKSILSLHSHSEEMNQTSLLSQDQEQSAFINELNRKNYFTTRFNTVNQLQLRDAIKKQFSNSVPSSHRQSPTYKTYDENVRKQQKSSTKSPPPQLSGGSLKKKCLSETRKPKKVTIRQQKRQVQEEYVQRKEEIIMNQENKEGNSQFNVIDFFDAVLKITKFQLDQLIPKDRRIQRRKKKFQVTSLFHYNNLKGLKILPQHRISTPRMSPMQPFNKHYKSPSINSQIFKTIEISKYCKCMNISQDQLSDCQVFLNDQVTTTIFTLVTPQVNTSQCTTSEQDDESPKAPKLIPTENTPLPDSNQPNSFLPLDKSTIPVIQKEPSEGSSKINLLASAQQPQGNRSKVKGSQIVHEIMTDCKVIVVLQDFYQDCLAIRPFFQELANQLDSQQKTFILCNLPGQAYTQYDPQSTSLNNNYHADCLDLLLYYLQQRNQIDILTNPYVIIGFGSGANIALNHAYSVSETTGMLKGVLSFNGFSYMDDIMKDSIQTCIDTYQSCPRQLQKTHGDFYLRNLVLTTGTLLLSEHIKTLEQQTAYSTSYATHCKILNSLGEYGKKEDIQVTVAMMKQREDAFITGGQSKQAKIDVCKGLIDYVDIKQSLSFLRVPVIIVQSRKNCFVHHNHSDALRDSGKNMIQEKEPKNSDILQENEQVKRDEERVKNNDIHRAIYQQIPRFQMFIDGGHNVLLENPLKAKQIIMNFAQAPVKHTIKSALTKANSESSSYRGSLSSSPVVHHKRNTTQEISHFQKNFIKEQGDNDY